MLKFQIALFPELDITKNHQINRNSKIKHTKVQQPSANIFNYVSGIIQDLHTIVRKGVAFCNLLYLMILF